MYELTQFYTGLACQFNKIMYSPCCKLQNSLYTETLKYMPCTGSIFIIKTIFLNAPNNVVYKTQ